MSFIKSRAYALFNQRVLTKEYTPLSRQSESKARKKSGSLDPNKSIDSSQITSVPQNVESATIKVSSLLSKETSIKEKKRDSDTFSIKDEFTDEPNQESNKDVIPEDLLELSIQKMSAYMDTVKKFVASAMAIPKLLTNVSPDIENILRDLNSKKASLEDLTRNMERTVLKLNFAFKTKCLSLNTFTRTKSPRRVKDLEGNYGSSPLLNRSAEFSTNLGYLDIDMKYKDLSFHNHNTSNPDLENLHQMVSYLEKKNNLLLKRLQSSEVYPRLEFRVLQGRPQTPDLRRRVSNDAEYPRSESAKIRNVKVERDEKSPIRRQINSMNAELTNIKKKVYLLESEKFSLLQEVQKLKQELQKANEGTKKTKMRYGDIKREINTLQAEKSRLKSYLDKTMSLYEDERSHSIKNKNTLKPKNKIPPLKALPVKVKRESTPNLELAMKEFKEMLKTKYGKIYERLQQKENELDFIGDVLKEKLKGFDSTFTHDEKDDTINFLPKSSRENENDPYLQSSNSLADLMNDISRTNMQRQLSEEKLKLVRRPSGALDESRKSYEGRAPLKAYRNELNQLEERKIGQRKRKSEDKRKLNSSLNYPSEDRSKNFGQSRDLKNLLQLSGISSLKGYSEQGPNSSRDIGSASARDLYKDSLLKESQNEEDIKLNEDQKQEKERICRAPRPFEAGKEIQKDERNRSEEGVRMEKAYVEQIQFLNGVIVDLKSVIQVLTDRLDAYESSGVKKIEEKNADELNINERLEIERLGQDLMTKEKELQEFKEVLANRNQEFELATKELQALKEKLAKKEHDILEVERNSNLKYKNALEGANREQKMNEERVKVLMMENEILRNEIDQLQISAQEFNEQKGNYEKIIRELEGAAKSNETAQESLVEKNRYLELQVTKVNGDLVGLRKTMEDLKKEVNIKEETIDKMVRTQNENEQVRRDMCAKMRDLEDNLGQLFG